MKQKVKFSAYALIITAAVMILSVVGIFSLIDAGEKLALFCIIMGATIAFGLYYCPKSIEATESGITLHRLLSAPKVFNYTSIQAIDTCYPSSGGLRLCASGGFFGYWGYFSDIMIGSYFGYYGSRSNCVLVKLKGGKQYVLGCENPALFVSFVNQKLQQP